MISGEPVSTWLPFCTTTWATVPSLGARISFSIFMASSTTSSWPSLTAAPWATSTRRMVPGMGEFTGSPAAVTAGAAGAAAGAGDAALAAGAAAAGAAGAGAKASYSSTSMALPASTSTS